MKKIETTRARQEFSDTLSQVAFAQDRIVLSRHGKEVAALIPMEDLQLLQECEDTLGRRGRKPRVRRAAAKTPRKGGPRALASGKRQRDGRDPGARRPGRRRRS